MFGTLFYLVVLITVICLAIGEWGENAGATLLGLIIFVAYFPLYGALKLLGWIGSEKGSEVVSNGLIYIVKLIFNIFKFLFANIKIISIGSVIIFVIATLIGPTIYKKIKTSKS
jgi:hypothetical protein